MGRLCQGIGVGPQGVGKRVNGTNTFHVICYDNIPMHQCKDVTYTSVVCDFKLHKLDPYRTWITIGRNLIFLNLQMKTN